MDKFTIIFFVLFKEKTDLQHILLLYGYFLRCRDIHFIEKNEGIISLLYSLSFLLPVLFVSFSLLPLLPSPFSSNMQSPFFFTIPCEEWPVLTLEQANEALESASGAFKQMFEGASGIPLNFGVVVTVCLGEKAGIGSGSSPVKKGSDETPLNSDSSIVVVVNPKLGASVDVEETTVDAL